MIRILFFGKLKEITGKKEIRINNCKTLNELKKFVFKKYPGLKKETFFIAVNREIVDKNVKLKDNDEVALLPPISGG